MPERRFGWNQMWHFLGELILSWFQVGTGTRIDLHIIAIFLVGIGFGVIAAKSGYVEFAPGAAIAGVVLYACAAIFWEISRYQRKKRSRFH